MDKAEKIKPTLVRIPDDLKEWLKEQAVENFRSMNGEIVARLQQSKKQKIEVITVPE